MYHKTDTAPQPQNLDEALMQYRLYEPSQDEPLTLVQDSSLSPEVKERWIEALLSGNYLQTIQKLKATISDDKVGYCCLGVLCEIENVPNRRVYDNINNRDRFEFEFNDQFFSNSSLDFGWAQKRGMNSSIGEFVIFFELFGEKFYQVLSLASLNDDGFTFEQIADVIDYFF
jgi:hypothetical protein